MRILRNYDVSSYYPSLMIQNGYSSRNIPSFETFKNVYYERIAAKKAGDKVKANTYKLALNTCYGATLNKYNDLYDPLMARSVCISGQLYLLELAEHLMKDVEGLKVVELNTDGIMVEFDDSHYDEVSAIVQEWQDRTHFGLEEDKVERYYAKDCNNYCEVVDGEVKVKGGYLVRGIAPAGAFKVNNNATVVATAIKEYFINGVEPEITIGNCDDISQFQIIAKAGSKYKESYHIVDGERQTVQKVNRVYATSDVRYGKLYKVKADNDSEAKIDSLPEHCIIDNSAISDPNHTKIDMVDKQFYIDMAHKRINDFKGIKPEKKERKPMAEKKTTATVEKMNVLQKLVTARKMFLDKHVQKSGANNHMMYEYFELSDIVPAATAIFHEVGLAHIVRMDADMAYMDIINVDDKNDTVTFSMPLAKWEGSKGVNPIQVAGMIVTYYRRYLYQIALDIVEQDEIDSRPQTETTAPAPVVPVKEAPKKPATPVERAEVKKELTNAEGAADTLQINQLKKVAKELKVKSNGTDKQEPVEKFLEELITKTEGFTKLTKSKCAAATEKITEIIGEL